MVLCAKYFFMSVLTKCFDGIKSLILCTTDNILPQVHNYEE